MMRAGTLTFWPSIFALLTMCTASSKDISPAPVITPPDLTAILQRLEGVQRQNPAESQPYEVTREYKVFRGDDKQPSSTVVIQINFAPPGKKTYRITRAEGKSRGEKMVRELLDQEIEAAKKIHESEISRANYDFVFLRQDKLGVHDEYVIRIIPKRKERYLFRGQIWVDTTTFHIRRLEGVPAKNPSFWITGVHITMQFAEVRGMWIPISFDAIATVRFLGQYMITARNTSADSPQPTLVAVGTHDGPLPVTKVRDFDFSGCPVLLTSPRELLKGFLVSATARWEIASRKYAACCLSARDEWRTKKRVRADS